MIMIGKNGNINDKQKLYLLDSQTSVQVIDDIANNVQNEKIISFDYDSHELLTNKKTAHQKSDDFLKEDEIQKIQQQDFKFAEWYDQSSINQFLLYKGINIGRLFYGETLWELVGFFKKFFEIKNIVEAYPNYSFITTSEIIYSITKIFSNSISLISQPNASKITLGTDRIRINFRIGNYQKIFFISKSFYSRLKNFSEIFINLVFKPKKSKNKKTLLVEFNTTRFKDLIQQSKNFPTDFIFYARRRPVVWNKESFKIIKNSGGKIITPTSLKNYEFRHTVEAGIKSQHKLILKMWENSIFLKKFFSINDVTFWPALEPIIKEIIEKRLPSTIYEIELIKQLFRRHDFDSILIMSEIGFTEQIITKEARDHGKEVILLQVGLNWDTPESSKANNSQGVYPIDADKFFVWGEVSKNDAINNGNVHQEKIKIVGSPRFDSIKPVINNTDDYVLLATSGPQGEDINGRLIKNFEQYRKTVTNIAQITKNQKKKLVVKLHPSPDEMDVTNLIREIDPNAIIEKTGDIIPLINSCSILIVLGMSTAIIEGQLLQKPVISIPVIDYKWGSPQVYNSKSCLVCNIDNLEENIIKLFNDKNFRESIILSGNNFIQQYLFHNGNSTKKILEYLTT